MESARVVETTVIGNPYLPNQRTTVGGYVMKDHLGSGAFGTVSLAEKGGRFYAIKAYNFKRIGENEQPQKLGELIGNEIKALGLLNHPNIMKIYEYFKTNNNLYLVLQYLEQGDLLQWIGKNKWLTEEQVLLILPQLADAFEQAQRLKIMHRDIKLENLFFDGNQVVVGDFGMAKVGSDIARTVLGTKTFWAPTDSDSPGYSYDADVWALAVTLYMSMFGKDPWEASSYSRVQPGAKLKLISFSGSGKRIKEMNSGFNLFYPPNSQVSDFLKFVFSQMLQIDPKKRISWAGLVKLLKTSPLQVGLQYRNIINLNQVIIEVAEAQEQELKSEILNRTRVGEGIVEILEECTEIITRMVVHPSLQKSMIFDTELEVENPPITSSIVNHTQFPNSSPFAVKEVIERYILYYFFMCKFHREVTIILLTAVNSNNELKHLIGVVNLAINMIWKKSRLIATYFIRKLTASCLEFTVIGKCPEFYQNGFAKQYLNDFQSIFDESTNIICESAAQAEIHLQEKYYRRAEQLLWAREVHDFNNLISEGLYLAIYFIFKGIENVRPEMKEQLKRWVVYLSTICKYDDCVIFNGKKDQFDEYSQILRKLKDSRNIDSMFEEEKTFFKNWRESL